MMANRPSTFTTIPTITTTTRAMAEVPHDNLTQSQSALSAHHSLLLSRNFTLQLEFICSLSSPSYLYNLAFSSSPTIPAPLSDPAFLRYLSHLHHTWSKPEYARYVHYPNGLYFCRLLVVSAEFRELVATQGQQWEAVTAQSLIKHWETWRREDQDEDDDDDDDCQDELSRIKV